METYCDGEGLAENDHKNEKSMFLECRAQH